MILQGVGPNKQRWVEFISSGSCPNASIHAEASIVPSSPFHPVALIQSKLGSHWEAVFKKKKEKSQNEFCIALMPTGRSSFVFCFFNFPVLLDSDAAPL